MEAWLGDRRGDDEGDGVEAWRKAWRSVDVGEARWTRLGRVRGAMGWLMRVGTRCGEHTPRSLGRGARGLDAKKKHEAHEDRYWGRSTVRLH